MTTKQTEQLLLNAHRHLKHAESMLECRFELSEGEYSYINVALHDKNAQESPLGQPCAEFARYPGQTSRVLARRIAEKYFVPYRVIREVVSYDTMSSIGGLWPTSDVRRAGKHVWARDYEISDEGIFDGRILYVTAMCTSLGHCTVTVRDVEWRERAKLLNPAPESFEVAVRTLR